MFESRRSKVKLIRVENNGNIVTAGEQAKADKPIIKERLNESMMHSVTLKR